MHDGSLESDLFGPSSLDLQHLWIDAICINQESLSERASRSGREPQSQFVNLAPHTNNGSLARANS